MADSALTLAVDRAYDLNALLIVCHTALDAVENTSATSEINSIAGAVKRVIREVGIPLAEGNIDVLEAAEADEAYLDAERLRQQIAKGAASA